MSAAAGSAEPVAENEQPEAAAAYEPEELDDTDPEEELPPQDVAPPPKGTILQIGTMEQGISNITTKAWLELARVPPQGGLMHSTFGAMASMHSVYAFRCRQDPGTDEYEKVYVVKGDGAVLVFDSDGDDFDYEAIGIGKGFLAQQAFEDAWRKGYLQLAGGPDPSLSPPAEAAAPRADELPELDPDVMAPLGGRLAVAYEKDDAYHWYGGVVDSVDPAGGRWIAFDNGDVEHLPLAEVREILALKGLKQLSVEEGGMIANETDHPMAAAIVWHKEGRMPSALPAGVLIGDTKEVVGGVPVYESFVVNGEAFTGTKELNMELGAATTRARTPTPRSAGNLKRGFHTFKRGNKVAMVLKNTDGAVTRYMATVFAVQHVKSQGHKYLHLVDDDTTTFFVARFTEWSRTLRQPDGDGDADDDELVDTLSSEQAPSMPPSTRHQ